MDSLIRLSPVDSAQQALLGSLDRAMSLAGRPPTAAMCSAMADSLTAAGHHLAALARAQAAADAEPLPLPYARLSEAFQAARALVRAND